MEYVDKTDDAPVCLECGDRIGYGRKDKKFCSETCRNRYHNQKHHYTRSVKLRILGILDKNYSVLEKLLRLDIRSISLGDAAQMGYNKEFVTSYHKMGGHDEFRCFDSKYRCSESRIFRIERVMPES